MKNLIIAALMLTVVSAKAQTKAVTNADGTQTTITRTGNNLFIIDSKGRHITVTNKGNHSVMMDETNYITFSRSGGTTTMTTSNGSMYNWIDGPQTVNLTDINGNSSPYNRNAEPFILSVGGRKFEVTVYKDAYTLGHLDGSNLVTTVAGNEVITDFPVTSTAVHQTSMGIKSKIINADGTYTTIIKNGDVYKVKTEYIITRVGNKFVIENPDGTKAETAGTGQLVIPALKANKPPLKR